MEEALRALLTGHAAVTALVPASRINFGKHPQGLPLPGVVINVVANGSADYSLDGPGLFDARVQIDAYGETYAQVKAVERAIRARLEGYRGGVFQMIGLLVASDRAEEVATNSPIHRVIMDYRVIYHP